MTQNVTIYPPSRTAMQSGRGKVGRWRLEYDLETAREPEPLMGWVSSGDTNNQVRIFFDSREEAVAFAEQKGWQYTVLNSRERKIKPRNYADNFKYRSAEEA